ncbi:coiled-coil domain-containing protein 189 isoform X2 [Pleuronectes platessa]|uniref:coiled-coil domain-containing protein 189 isoform X2 n=1 Tax=Pleuronectes platessa TaxID=8262 RepID=UPI00232A7A14|nr:coiled-coil domain-containing protein 189 isoform X2 [Pleuronectes platessa]
MDVTIKVPQTLKAKVMLWTDASFHDMEVIDNTQSRPDLERVVGSVFGVDLAEPKRGVLLELYVQTVIFCRKFSFNMEQTSALLSIIKSIHEANIETPLNNLEQCFDYCKELLLCHSVRRPPFSINLFSPKEADFILNYIYNSYMRHYKLYKYIFTPQVKLDLSLTYVGIPDEDSSAAGAEDAPMKEDSTDTQDTSLTEEEKSMLGHTSDLKAIVETEVRDQMMLLSGQLDKRMNEIADQHKTLDSPQPNHKAKK